ncbi:MAG: hypothetical protein WCJ72_05300 [Chryseobacterium sp.]
MSDMDLINERFRQQDKMIDLLRLRVTALENILKKTIPNFEDKLSEEYKILDPKMGGKITNHSSGVSHELCQYKLTLY